MTRKHYFPTLPPKLHLTYVYGDQKDHSPAAPQKSSLTPAGGCSHHGHVWRYSVLMSWQCHDCFPGWALAVILSLLQIPFRFSCLQLGDPSWNTSEVWGQLWYMVFLVLQLITYNNQKRKKKCKKKKKYTFPLIFLDKVVLLILQWTYCLNNFNVPDFQNAYQWP